MLIYIVISFRLPIGILIGLDLHLHSYLVYASSEGYGESAHMLIRYVHVQKYHGLPDIFLQPKWANMTADGFFSFVHFGISLLHFSRFSLNICVYLFTNQYKVINS